MAESLSAESVFIKKTSSRFEDSEQEILRYRQAKQTAMEQLQGLYQKALKEVGEANAAIFEIHQMMLEDDDYNESVENIIRMQQVNAEYAVASTGDNFAQMFSAMDDDYMRARSADVPLGTQKTFIRGTDPSIPTRQFWPGP